MQTVAISQPMYFPWVGLFEQVRLADRYVHYDDVQRSKGDLTNRVQIKTAAGIKWLTVPLKHATLGQRINEVCLEDRTDWQTRHLDQLKQAYAKAPYRAVMLELVRRVFDQRANNLAELSRATIHAVAAYYALDTETRFAVSSQLDVAGRGSERVLSLVQKLDGERYVTGHGGRHYLDHPSFDASHIAVEYMDYAMAIYPQLHGAFTPFVSVLDLIANMGQAGMVCICSGTVPWREFVGQDLGGRNGAVSRTALSKQSSAPPRPLGCPARWGREGCVW